MKVLMKKRLKPPKLTLKDFIIYFFISFIIVHHHLKSKEKIVTLKVLLSRNLPRYNGIDITLDFKKRPICTHCKKNHSLVI